MTWQEVRGWTSVGCELAAIAVTLAACVCPRRWRGGLARLVAALLAVVLVAALT